jgi:precorrin-3B synthase
MVTGDGLLARITPSSPISLDAFVTLCEAAQAHGNGIMEVTQRGSLQVRGLSQARSGWLTKTCLRS